MSLPMEYAELQKIITLTKFLHKKFFDEDLKFSDQGVLDLDKSNNISGVLHTLYTYMRKINNSNVNARGNFNADKTAIIGTKSFTISAMYEEYKKTDNYVIFDFMIATPLVDMLTSFRCMYSEVRMSCGKFEMRIDGQKREKRVIDFGLDNTNAPYLTGITFKPERRTGLIQTMGPLTLALLLANETRYTDKLENALKEALKMFPMSQAIIDCLKGTRSALESGGLFKSLGMALPILGLETHIKIHFPLYYIVAMNDLNPADLQPFNFSGIKGIRIYNDYCSNLKWMKKSRGISEDLAQIVFHSIFGTSIQDLSILRQITTCPVWEKRSDLNEVFAKLSDASSKQFTPIRFIYISKSATANMLKNVGTLQPQLYSRMIFSGKRKRNYTQAFMDYLGNAARGSAYSTNPTTLAYEIKMFKDRHSEKIRELKMREAETTKWFSVEENYIEVDRCFEESNEYFYV